MANLFLVYTPFHAGYARTIIAQHFAGEQNHIFNHYRVAVVVSPGDHVTEVKNAGASLTGGLMALYSFKKEMLKDAQSGKAVNIFIPHTLGILSNYAYHRLVKKYKNVRVHVFYEGIIMFYSYVHGYRANIKYYASRLLAGLSLGIVYVPDRHLLNPDDERITNIYSPFLNIAAPREKIILTPLDGLSFIPEEKCGLILGIMLAKDQGDELRRIVEGIYKQVKELGLSKVYYKEHPLERSDVFREVAVKAGVSLIPITDTSPIEKIIHLYKPSFVFSSWSSGIINLRSILPDTTRLYCFITEAISGSPETKKIVNAFIAEGITVNYV